MESGSVVHAGRWCETHDQGNSAPFPNSTKSSDSVISRDIDERRIATILRSSLSHSSPIRSRQNFAGLGSPGAIHADPDVCPNRLPTIDFTSLSAGIAPTTGR